MDNIDVSSFLTNAGGWVFAGAVLGAVIYAFLSGKIVSGALLDRSMTQHEKILPAVTQLIQTVERLVDSQREIAFSQDDIRRDVEEVRVALNLSIRSERPRVERHRQLPPSST